ncbi:MAG: PEP-CTERM system histidine kinase PrsK [Geobacteraceae bacterium]|nr:PEP-CTERM system histidine kinase PrsK [Geobacteraceae bacterium]NTW80773.1 PEP-CTERM system histidine kinase PrsK [Geobacteraceae bacterium]
MGNVIISIAAIIILLAGAGYALFKDRCRTGLFLSAAITATALLELFDLLSLHASDAFFWKKCALFAEALLPLFWILCSLTFARQSGPWKISPILKGVVASTLLFLAVSIILPLNSFFYAPDFPDERLLFLGNAGYFFYIALMACLIYAIVNFEVTLTNASPDSFWKIKYEIIGIGTILAVQVFYYSQALLYRSLNMNYLPLRSFLYIVAAALIAYSLACRRGKVCIQVSRQIAFKSFVLFAVGIYLIMIGILGEGMKYLGGYFPRTVTVSVAFLIGIVLLALMLSDRFRREVKVVLHKNFYQNKHDYRTQWLRFTELLATARTLDELQQRILSAYCEIFGTGGAVLFLYEEVYNGYCMSAGYNMERIPDVLTADNSLIKFMKGNAWVINIRDDTSEILEENGYFFGENSIFIVIPLFDGKNLEGFIALGKSIDTNESFIYEDYDLMKTIARQASLALLHQKQSEQITHAREIEAIGTVATFVAHDLKNLVSNLSLIVENAARHIQNTDFQNDMLASLGNTVVKMKKLISRMKNLGEQDLINQQQVNLLELAERTAHLVVGKKVLVSGTSEIVRLDESEIQKVVMNLLINGIEATVTDDPVAIEVGRSCGQPFIKVIDRGCGMPIGFLQRELFRPFKTTKEQGLGIGLYQCRQIVEAHGGRIEVSSVVGSGSVFTVWFAASESQQAEAE